MIVEGSVSMINLDRYDLHVSVAEGLLSRVIDELSNHLPTLMTPQTLINAMKQLNA
jgi:hypothetical protein